MASDKLVGKYSLGSFSCIFNNQFGLSSNLAVYAFISLLVLLTNRSQRVYSEYKD